MLTVRVFINDPETLSDREATAVKRVQAAAGRFPERVEVEILSLDSDEALDFGATVAPTIIIGETVISVQEPPLAGQIKRFIEMELGES